MSDIILFAEALYKKYNEQDGFVINNLSFELAQNEKVALLGQSGCGKSTLLHLFCGLDSVTSGKIIFKEKNIAQMSDDKLTQIRKEHFGFVYQFHNLLQEFSAKENVMLPQLIKGIKPKMAEERSEFLLGLFGLSNKKESFPSELSGGQRQRIAIARAIANSPTILLADEPTGNLDVNTSQKVMEEMLTILNDLNISAVIATHNLEISNMLDRKFVLGNHNNDEI